MKRLLIFCLFILSSLCTTPTWAEDIELDEGEMVGPPPNLPVEVKTRFFLLNLITINEKEEYFTADVYFTFIWKDPRQGFTSRRENDVKIFLEESVITKLNTMWRPQIEFVNGEEVKYINRSLLIFPDGTVEYHMGLNAKFYSDLNLKKFPFDTQSLKIVVDSFSWNKNVLQFVADTQGTLVDPSKDLYLEKEVLQVTESVESIPGLKISHFGGVNDFSSYQVTIKLKREPNYFIYQVFVPLFILIGISCAVFFGHKEPFLDKIMISLTTFLVVLAAKFVVNQELPEIGYMTLIDVSFFLAYICIGLSVVIDVLYQMNKEKRNTLVIHINNYARWAIFAFFTISLIVIFLIGVFSK